jgi:ABC-2 type transport system ATP-binding protein
MNAIEIKNLRKRFEENREVTWALDGIDLAIKKNQIFGLLGPNGAGKTTLIYVLSTMILPTSGEARVLGYDVLKQGNEVRTRSGLVMGGTSFYWDMNAREILEYYGRLYGLKRDFREKRKNELIKRLGIKSFENKSFANLSTGMRQKIAVAKGLINDPEVLFLDEPTAGLDVEVAADVRDFIMDMIQETDMTVILTSHQMQEVEQMCKQVAIINKGKLVTKGGIPEIRKSLKIPDIIHLYLSDYSSAKLGVLKKVPGVLNYGVSDGLFISVDSGLKRMDAISRALGRKGIKIKDLEIRKASLEEVFLSVVGRKGSARPYGTYRAE